MFRSPMWTSVIQAICLSTLGDMASHYLVERALAGISNPGPIGGDSVNTTLFDSLTATTDATKPHVAGQSSYFSTLPRKVLCLGATTILSYLWNIWLERAFPARPRGSTVLPETTKTDKFEDYEQVEEEIVKKWIAQGKVQRSTISWSNTLIKWLLNLSIGNLAVCALWIVVEQLAQFHHPTELISKTTTELKQTILFQYIGTFFSPIPIASLIGFIIIPAYKRIVFEAGVNLLWNVFLGAFLAVLVPWLMTIESFRESVQQAAGNASLATTNGSLVEHEL